MSDANTLVRTALPASVRTETGNGGLTRLAISSRHGTAQVYFQGAHVSAWHPAGVAAPVLWMSRESWYEPNKPLRGGVPICFPWFGTHATEPTAPGHGFARLFPWTLIAAQESGGGVVNLAFELTSATATSPLWPHTYRLTHRVTIGPSLVMALEVRNTGTGPFTFEEALHTYFAVQDVRQVTITGLEDTEYREKFAPSGRGRQGREPIRFVRETDRTYLNTRAAIVLHDPGKRRTITNHKVNSDSTNVWNPWVDKARAMPDFGDTEWPEMVCIETSNVRAHALTLAPGESHTMTARLDVRELS